MTTEVAFTPERSGIYRMPSDTRKAREATREAGAAWFDVDLKKGHSKAEVLSALAKALSFPKTFGQNWDALADSLQDLSWLPGEGYVVALTGTGSARRTPEWETL